MLSLKRAALNNKWAYLRERNRLSFHVFLHKYISRAFAERQFPSDAIRVTVASQRSGATLGGSYDDGSGASRDYGGTCEEASEAPQAVGPRRQPVGREEGGREVFRRSHTGKLSTVTSQCHTNDTYDEQPRLATSKVRKQSMKNKRNSLKRALAAAFPAFGWHTFRGTFAREVPGTCMR